MKINYSKNNKGFTLVEFLVYISGMIIISAILTMVVVQFYGIYKDLILVPRADRAGLMIVDRITRELRVANQVDSINSVFGSTNGVIVFDVYNSGSLTKKRFFVEDGIVKYQENNGEIQSLTSENLNVSNLNFTLANTDVSSAVRLNVEIQYNDRDGIETKDYTGFAILRESYE